MSVFEAVKNWLNEIEEVKTLANGEIKTSILQSGVQKQSAVLVDNGSVVTETDIAGNSTIVSIFTFVATAPIIKEEHKKTLQAAFESIAKAARKANLSDNYPEKIENIKTGKISIAQADNSGFATVTMQINVQYKEERNFYVN